MSIISKYQISSLFAAVLLLTACEHTPPDHRDPVTLPLYVNGDADNGSLIYQDACSQCHQLNAGLNKKGPQLMNIYGAPAAELKDYTYSEGAHKVRMGMGRQNTRSLYRGCTKSHARFKDAIRPYARC
ncbi:c-type cytochrome [Psychrobacter sp. KH172YL61]|uniref:c-type cytochrome n=1 Tax=Psychrobacter sp. KH172YL61 TaxID=2517899 RepID=UPI001F07906D|nr:c-type cytochrome [Psychrobacter sp. KH172YL61]